MLIIWLSKGPIKKFSKLFILVKCLELAVTFKHLVKTVNHLHTNNKRNFGFIKKTVFL